jgi:Replication initiator protein, pSAM2
MRPGHCRGKAHRRAYLGYAGRRVLVSRRWSGKTLTDHKADRRAWLLAMLDLPDLSATETGRYSWQRVTPADPDHIPPAAALLHILTDRSRQKAALALARERATGQGSLPASAQEVA